VIDKIKILENKLKEKLSNIPSEELESIKDYLIEKQDGVCFICKKNDLRNNFGVMHYAYSFSVPELTNKLLISHEFCLNSRYNPISIILFY